MDLVLLFHALLIALLIVVCFSIAWTIVPFLGVVNKVGEDENEEEAYDRLMEEEDYDLLAFIDGCRNTKILIFILVAVACVNIGIQIGMIN